MRLGLSSLKIVGTPLGLLEHRVSDLSEALKISVLHCGRSQDSKAPPPALSANRFETDLGAIRALDDAVVRLRRSGLASEQPGR
jgi:hypothetical protein